MNANAYQQSLEAYKQPKGENDIDLIQEVRNLLLTAGLHTLVEQNFDTNRFIIDAAGKTSNVQRYLLNRYWNMQLLYSSKPTSEERYCLIPDGEVSDWLKLFKEKVFPFVIENQLPVKI